MRVSGVGSIGHHGSKLFLGTTHVEEISKIVIIHADQEVEGIEIRSIDLSRLGGQFDSMTQRDIDAALVGRTADMPPTGSSRLDSDHVPEGALLQVMQEKTFSEGAATDVAHADEKNPMDDNHLENRESEIATQTMKRLSTCEKRESSRSDSAGMRK